MAVLSRNIPHLVVALIALLLAGGCRGNTPQNPQPSSGANSSAAAAPTTSESGEPLRPRIVMLGDSLTAGLGLLESQAFPALIQQKIDTEGYKFEVVNAGVSGDTSAGGVRRLDWALEGDVKVMVIALGANDGLRGLSVEEMKNNISQIIERARDRGVLCILAGMEAPPNFGPEFTTAFRHAFRDIAVKYRLLFLPFLLDNVAGQAALNQGDGVHPNQQGAAIVAENVWRVLRPVLDQLPATQ